MHLTPHSMRQLAVTAGVVAGLLAGVTGCGSAGPTNPTPSATAALTTAVTVPSPGPTEDQREGADRAEVDRVYREFWRVTWTLDQRPESEWTQAMASVAVDPVAARLLATARVFRQRGITAWGSVMPHPTIPAVHGANKITVTDCQDASRGGQADAKTGDKKTVGVARSPVTATLVRTSAGWRVSDTAYTGGTCR